MKAIICGGGTAGHVTPGIAIADILRTRERSPEIIFVGRDGGEENKPIIDRGYRLQCIKASGLKRSFSRENVKCLLNTLRATRTMKQFLKKERPDVVIGTGGYVCYPVIKAAAALKIPTVLHESNAICGLTTRLLAPICDVLLLNFPLQKSKITKKVRSVVVGNPLPRTLYEESRLSARRRLGIRDRELMILSFGGSGGAEKVNDAVIKLIGSYSSKRACIKHFHSSGTRYYKDIEAAHPELCKGAGGCRIFPYISNMHEYIKAADIIISRCGAMTLSEICASEATPILIPSPNVTDNHQYENARRFCDSGAALMIEEGELCERTLLDAVRYLEQNPSIRRRMQKQLKSFYCPDSNDRIYSEIKSVMER